MAGKAAYGAVCAVFLEGARKAMSGEAFSAALEDAGVGGKIRGALAEAFSGSRAELVAAVAVVGAGLGLARVVDVRWRVDHVVRSRYVERIGSPMWLVELIMADGSVEAFSCNAEQLQDLATRIRDATRQPQRIAEGN